MFSVVLCSSIQTKLKLLQHPHCCHHCLQVCSNVLLFVMTNSWPQRMLIGHATLRPAENELERSFSRWSREISVMKPYVLLQMTQVHYLIPTIPHLNEKIFDFTFIIYD